VTDHTTSGCRETPVINLLCNLRLYLVCLFWVRAQASSSKPQAGQLVLDAMRGMR